MNEIEGNIAKLECGEICGNAILLNGRFALTVKHCIEPYINKGEKITLYCYDGRGFVAREAEAVAYPDDEDGYAILQLEWMWLKEITLMPYPVRPFEKCTSIGFNHNHNEKPSWRKLVSNGNSNVKLEDMVCDLMFIDASKEKSVEGLSGSPILLGEGSNIVIGLITQQKLEKGNTIEIAGISVLSQKEFLLRNGIEVKTKTSILVDEKDGILKKAQLEISLHLNICDFFLPENVFYYGSNHSVMALVYVFNKTVFTRAVLQEHVSVIVHYYENSPESGLEYRPPGGDSDFEMTDLKCHLEGRTGVFPVQIISNDEKVHYLRFQKMGQQYMRLFLETPQPGVYVVSMRMEYYDNGSVAIAESETVKFRVSQFTRETLFERLYTSCDE